MVKKRRKFSKEVKLETVKLFKESRKPLAQAARDLGLSETAIRNWVRQHDIDEGKGPPEAMTTAEREELRKLRKENRQLKMERHLPKKAATFFAKESE